ncbi:MAG: hypothetical protein IV100_09165 [Myxococcales bacterium]|nr:hypothetical protein [Myxococcales bacterium]
MFNVKVSLLYFLLIVLGVVAVSHHVGQGRDEAGRLAEASLEAMPPMVSANQRLREQRLVEVARTLAASAVSNALAKVRAGDTKGASAVLTDALKRAEADVDPEFARHQPDFVVLYGASGKALAASAGAPDSATADSRRVRSPEEGVTLDVYTGAHGAADADKATWLAAVISVAGNEASPGAEAGTLLVGRRIDADLAASDRVLFDRDVTYVHDQRVVASTLAGADHRIVVASGANGLGGDDAVRHLISSPDWLAVSVPFRANDAASAIAYGPGYGKVRIVLATPRERWEGHFAVLQRLVPLVGGGLFVLGVFLFWALIRNHTRSYEQIDAGIHEVISGNFDFQFPVDYSEDLPNQMAQNLNLMLAVMTGRPLADDAALGSARTPPASPGTGASAGSSGRGAASSTAGAPVAAMALTAGGIADFEIVREPEAVSADILSEPTEQYLKRLYEEWRRVAKAEVMPYVRFVEQLVRTERRLKQSLACRHVRFRTETRGEKVMLVPLAVM